MATATGIRPYRPDIDGLRSIAILAVLLAHGGFAPFSGGDTAMTAFFVISGYLVSQAALRSDGVPSIGEFYDRRARRMLPTLIVATAATLVAGSLLLSPGEVGGLARAALVSVALVSNVAPVVDPGAEPLLHTWSLSMAGQIFLILPVGLVLLARLGARATLPLVLIGTLVSFSIAARGAPWAGAVQVHHRIWEFGIGALVMVLPAMQPKRPIAELAAIVGIAAIVAPVLFYPPEAPRSGVGALPTALGAALVIWANRGETTARAALGSSPLVFLGVISYSLYVWHWPMLVFAKRIWGDLDTWAAVVWLGATVLVATASWYFVEQPLRYPTGPIRSRAAVLAASLAGVASVAALAAVVASEATVAGRQGIAAAYAGVSPRMSAGNLAISRVGNYDTKTRVKSFLIDE